ncbi:hypothetical protein ACFSUD_09370 [Sulfitobacter aestuarii]|uniref:Uncharacterized protein n=1 Tax=Sulfitobacter aestuarii TaxID=2161676 RepID=A0ABW5U407_9RHOB
MSRRRLAMAIGAVLCIALSLFMLRVEQDPLTARAQGYAADIAVRAGGTYVTLRTLNAVLSTAQEVEIGMSFIASGTAQPLKVLEPVDDTIERIAALVFGVMIATGVLAVALGPVSALGLIVLGTALAVAALAPRRVAVRQLGWYGAFFGLALPLGLTVAAPLAQMLTEATYSRNIALIAEITQVVQDADSPQEVELGINDYRRIAASLWEDADRLTGALVAIVGVYMFRILILPLLLNGGLFLAMRGVARAPAAAPDGAGRRHGGH